MSRPVPMDARGHNGVYSAEERFWAKVRGGDVTTCWIWQGSTTVGYGRFQCDGVTIIAHRWAYEFLVGPVPEGLQLDHLCENRACVNPWHLDPVTPLVNTRRAFAKIHERPTYPCGHPRTDENTRIQRHYGRRADGRICLTCQRARVRAWKAARRAATRQEAVA